MAPDWLKVGAKRLVVHLETVTEQTLSEIHAQASALGAEVFLAMGPETSIENLWTLVKKCDGFQILSVHPGFAGQAYLPLSLEKLQFLRQSWPKSKIEMDGGMDLERAKLSVSAGANILASASYIFENPDPAKAYNNLKNL